MIPPVRQELRDWGAFGLLALVWGSSFLWIRIGLDELRPMMLVWLRLGIGLAGLLVVLGLTGGRLPRDRRLLAAFGFMGLFNTALPFVLITWGETRIDSGLAAILNGTVPLFVLVIAHFWLHDERLTRARLVGLAVGFLGVVVLVSRDLGPEGFRGNVLGQLAVLAASLSYAAAVTFSRRHLRDQAPAVQSAMVLLFAFGIMGVVTPVAEQPLRLPALPLTWVAVVWLGLLGSCLAYLLYFHLIRAWGATRASLVTYLMPVIGLALGIVFRDEVADWQLWTGSLLVVGGILVVSRRPRVRSAQMG